MKYIQFKSDWGEEVFVTFPDNIDHNIMAQATALASVRSKKSAMLTPVSAGFVYDLHGLPYGRSESLNLDSRPNDCGYKTVKEYT